MAAAPKIVVTGAGAICGAGATPADILAAVCEGRSAIAPIRQWDATNWPVRVAAEVADYNPTTLVEDRKIHKVVRRRDLFGLYAAARAIDESGLLGYRKTLGPDAAEQLSDRTGVYVGTGGGSYQDQYEYLPLLTTAAGDLATFGRELGATVNPMWLLRSLPNNVLCHIGIRYGLKGPNACVTNHSVSGALAIVEAVAALRAGEADRAVAVGHDAPIEPQMVLYYHRVGLLAADMLRPFDAARGGSVLGEGAAAVVVETASAAASRRATVLGEILGSGCASEAAGVFAIRADGEGLAQAIGLALDDAGLRAADVGMICAHGNGTRQSDASEAAALRRVFGASLPPITACKWATGHLIAASGAMDTVLTLAFLRCGTVPGIATLRQRDATFDDLPVMAQAGTPRSDIGLILSRGFAGANAALLVRASKMN